MEKSKTKISSPRRRSPLRSPKSPKSPSKSPSKSRNIKPLSKSPDKDNKTTDSLNKVNTFDSELNKKDPLPKLKNDLVIPAKYGDRLEMLRQLFSNDDIKYYSNDAPSNNINKVRDIAKYFLLKTGTTSEYISAIIYYMYKNIKLDLNSINIRKEKVQPQTAENVLKTQIGLSEGICNLFKEFLAYGNIKVEIIKGLMKRKNYKYGENVYKHHWCVIYFGKNFYFTDPTLLIGKIEDDNTFINEISLYYFLTPLEFLQETHRPEEDKWQYNKNKLINIKQFTMRVPYYYVDFYSNILKNKIHLISHSYPEFICKDSEVEIHLAAEDSELKLEVTLNGKQLEEKQALCFFDNKQRCYISTITFPSNGEYIATFLGKGPSIAESTFTPFVKYKILVTILNPKKKPVNPNFKPYIPSQPRNSASPEPGQVIGRPEKRLSKSASDFDKKMKKKCYDNTHAHLYEPKSHFLRIGQDTKFKVRIKGAKSVFVLDGRKWNFLKKTSEDDIYEGSVTPSSPNIVICSLKENNVYTEVFEFYASKK